MFTVLAVRREYFRRRKGATGTAAGSRVEEADFGRAGTDEPAKTKRPKRTKSAVVQKEKE